MDEVIDQLKHLRAVHLSLVAICSTTLYLALAQSSPAALAREIQELRAFALSAAEEPATMIANHQEPWVRSRLEPMRRSLQAHVAPEGAFELRWEGMGWETARSKAIRVPTWPQFPDLPRATLSDQRALMAQRPATVSYIAEVTGCKGSIAQIGPEAGLLGRVLDIADLHVSHWPSEGRRGSVEFIVRDTRYIALSSRRSESLQYQNTYRTAIPVACQFVTRADTIAALVGIAWFESRFPRLGDSWELLAGLPSDRAEAKAEAIDKVKNRDIDVSVLGVPLQPRLFGYALPVIVLSVLGYIWALVRHLQQHLKGIAELQGLTPWICTYTEPISQALSIATLAILPALSVALALASLAWPAPGQGLAFLGFVGFIVAGMVVFRECQEFGKTAGRSVPGTESV
jgi:hypothetical protein